MSEPRSTARTAGRVVSHLGVMALVSVVLGVVVAGLAIPFAGVAGIGTRNLADTMDQLPAQLETGTLDQRTTILDRNGDVLATVYDQNRVEVPLSQVSRKMVKAMLATEDARFYQHGALDLQGTLRAFITNQAESGTVQGGSSITQQLVKQTLLYQAGDNKKEQAAATADTYARKLQELRYAVALEQNHSKDWILQRYLNTVYFGDGAYGIQSAAKHFFNVNASDLSLLQSATLAGLVRNPSGYDPIDDPQAATNRRNVVLQRMVSVGIIKQRRANKLSKRDLGLDPQRTTNGCTQSTAPFFCQYVINYLKTDPALGDNRKARENLIETGGLTIKTTLAPNYQKAADTAVSSHVYPTDQAIGGLAMVQPGTGEVFAIAQSRPMGTDKAKGQSYINYTVPKRYGNSGGFQPGSTFKAFVLAAAIEKGVPLSKTIYSPPHIDVPQNSFKVCGGKNYQSTADYPVNNSTDPGTSNPNLYQGTQYSVNTFFVQLEQQIGLCKPYKLAKRMGITGLQDTNKWMVPSFTLGVASVSPLEMADAYATFAARGLYCSPRPVTSISDANGNELKTYPAKCRQVMQNSTADAVNDILTGVIAPGGFASAQQLDSPAAGKTGTTQDGKSVWFVGYTPDMAAAAMIAGANQYGTPISLTYQTVGGRTIYSASGSGYAAPIWGDAMKAIMGQLPNDSFVAPNASDVAGVPTTVPDVYGRSLDGARKQLEAAGFTVAYGSYINSTYPEGTVAATSPSVGSTAPSGSTITILQSNGTPPAPSKPDKPKKSGGGDKNKPGKGKNKGRGRG
ncbi:penicillin-binding protein [Nocardioides acrostichi]|uniref:Transglycosylase domain-containing protein n=1 Tax=Nocardioides acrostichi TaxID=2784339 RepID=A0A930V3B2_9ACTN|nr:transglycosylase domain-containing protein [Nocardioides acrostichi]MBF4163214.1 transglycosylase domain-containing protein [Nocardioides acrostichi]